jgi:uncharacterized protein (DUF58 family)
VFSEGTLRGLRLERRIPRGLHAGQPFLIEFALHNDKRRRASYAIEIEDLVEVAGTPRPLDKRCFFLKVPAAAAQTATYRHTFLHRGVHRLAGARVGTRFPFGLFRKARDVELPAEVLVYPRWCR